MKVSLAKKLEELSDFFGVDGDVEHMLHELCHVVTLVDEDLIDDNRFEENINRAVRILSEAKSDWNEIKTLACQFVVFKEASLVSYRDSVCHLVGIASFHTMSREEVEGHVLRCMQNKTADRRAEEVKDLIDRTWHQLC